MIETHLGDCVEVMRTLPEGSIDLVITSPPYNLHNTTGGGFSRNVWDSSLWKAPEFADAYESHHDAMPRPDYIKWQNDVLNAAWRLLKPTGAIFFNHKPRVQAGIYEMPLELNPGLPLRQIIYWYRGGGGINFSTRFYLPTVEWILIFAKPDFELKTKGAGKMGDMWNFLPERTNPHPAAFPLDLPRRILETAPATRVLDPFMGSGTTGVACVERGIDFIGIDNSEKYLKMARYRMERAKDHDLTSWTTLFDEGCNQVKLPGTRLEDLFV